ncbi:MAG: glycine cleavage system protein R [Gammaproteobacteria bacterium]|nr:glycine cleavage system protein R [Gammaproteobacteria bacterium]
MNNTGTQQLAISALAQNGEQALRKLAEQAAQSGCNLVEARAIPTGDRTTVVLLADGTWDALVRLERALPRLGEQIAAEVFSTRVKPAPNFDRRIPYAVDLSSADKPGVLSGLIEFFASRDILIMELTARAYPAAHTGAPMFMVQMNVGLPQDMHIAGIREEFMDFCDNANLDAILEPIKS